MNESRVTPIFVELGNGIIINTMFIVDIVKTSNGDDISYYLRVNDGASNTNNIYTLSENEYCYLRFLLIK